MIALLCFVLTLLASPFRSKRQRIYLVSLCFGVFIDCNAKPKRELIRATRAVRDMGRACCVNE